MGACATKPKALDGPVPEDEPIESTAIASDVSSAPVEAATTTTEVVADSKEIRGEEGKEEPQVDLSEPKHEETGKAATLMDEQHKEKTAVMEKVDDAAKTEEKPSTST